eukprot:Selendium_serpulae@DN5899_c0_g1_i5.p2
MFDARLFNQSSGLDSGYAAGHDESYAIYDKPLFASRTAASGMYRFDKDRMEETMGSSSSVPSFGGADRAQVRTAPVEFEKDNADPFDLDNLVTMSSNVEQNKDGKNKEKERQSKGRDKD